MITRSTALFSLAAALTSATALAEPATTPLRDGWSLQTSVKATAGGAAISQPGFATSGWYPAQVPSTVMGALVKAGVYKDPFYAKNMASIPEAPFKTSWWYRVQWNDKAARPGESVRLVFEGINYRADVWVNGKKVADRAKLAGVWRVQEIDISREVRDGVNALAVEVSPPKPGDYTIGFVDWNPVPPDKNMGLYRGVQVRRAGAVSIEEPFVQTKVDTKTLKEASLTISAVVANRTDKPVAGKLLGEIGKIKFQASYALAPTEKKTITVTPAEAAALKIKNPKLWWPVNLGNPELHTLKLTARNDEEKAPSDVRSVEFGIREVATYLSPEGYRGYTVNGQKVLIRGGGWVDEIFLREDDRNLEAQLDYVRHMNFNTVRLEGFWGSSQKLYDLADRKGILVITGYSCQWEWDHYLGAAQDHKKYGAAKDGPNADLLVSYLHDQVVWLRNHPSVLVWAVGSDKLPWPDVERRYQSMLKEVDPTRPYLASAKGWDSEVSGPTAVKMLGPYNYVTPNYWWEDKTHGGAYGFNTETGPGPQIPPLSSLKKVIPADKLWPPTNEMWNYHCAEHEYSDLKLFLNAFDHRYGPTKTVEELAFKSQAASYEAMRAMFEAFGANKPKTTGLIQWMLNASWPKLYWQLYDYFLTPTGAFYGARKGSQPQHLSYDPSGRGVYLVNDTLAAVKGATAVVTLLDASSKPAFQTKQKVSIDGNASAKVLDIPALDAKSPTYFLDLKLKSAGGKVISQNFYWLSPKADVLDPEKSTEPFMPNKSFADFTAVNSLPTAKVKVSSSFKKDGGQVTLANTSDKLAFFIELQVTKGAGADPVLPVRWEDNYVSLLPGESKTLKVAYADADLGGAKPALAVQGWNVEVVK
jgi:exo-1,4-beta-D-glucosaminidase